MFGFRTSYTYGYYGLMDSDSDDNDDNIVLKSHRKNNGEKQK